jgi:hypothetical protein
MSSYQKRKVAALRDLCEERGLDPNGNKSHLIQRLRQYDYGKNINAVENGDVSNNDHLDQYDDVEDEEVNLIHDVGVDARNGVDGDEHINLRALELQLALEQTMHHGSYCRVKNATAAWSANVSE